MQSSVTFTVKCPQCRRASLWGTWKFFKHNTSCVTKAHNSTPKSGKMSKDSQNKNLDWNLTRLLVYKKASWKQTVKGGENVDSKQPRRKVAQPTVTQMLAKTTACMRKVQKNQVVKLLVECNLKYINILITFCGFRRWTWGKILEESLAGVTNEWRNLSERDVVKVSNTNHSWWDSQMGKPAHLSVLSWKPWKSACWQHNFHFHGDTTI